MGSESDVFMLNVMRGHFVNYVIGIFDKCETLHFHHSLRLLTYLFADDDDEDDDDDDDDYDDDDEDEDDMHYYYYSFNEDDDGCGADQGLGQGGLGCGRGGPLNNNADPDFVPFDCLTPEQTEKFLMETVDIAAKKFNVNMSHFSYVCCLIFYV